VYERESGLVKAVGIYEVDPSTQKRMERICIEVYNAGTQPIYEPSIIVRVPHGASSTDHWDGVGSTDYWEGMRPTMLSGRLRPLPHRPWRRQRRALFTWRAADPWPQVVGARQSVRLEFRWLDGLADWNWYAEPIGVHFLDAQGAQWTRQPNGELRRGVSLGYGMTITPDEL
jgi:hypothetical protein